MKHRRKTEVVDAWQWQGTGTPEAPEWVVESTWVSSGLEVGKVRRIGSYLHFAGHYGMETLSPGDWLVREGDGRIVVCRRGEFSRYYEPHVDLEMAAAILGAGA